jgi:hypothetical protein
MGTQTEARYVASWTIGLGEPLDIRHLHIHAGAGRHQGRLCGTA